MDIRSLLSKTWKYSLVSFLLQIPTIVLAWGTSFACADYYWTDDSGSFSKCPSYHYLLWAYFLIPLLIVGFLFIRKYNWKYLLTFILLIIALNMLAFLLFSGWVFLKTH